MTRCVCGHGPLQHLPDCHGFVRDDRGIMSGACSCTQFTAEDDEMLAAHRRDMTEERRLRDLINTLDGLLQNPPASARATTILKVHQARVDIWNDILTIQKRWD